MPEQLLLIKAKSNKQMKDALNIISAMYDLEVRKMGEVENKTLIEILKYPPMKIVKCDWCGGSGIINRRGMIISDPCPECNDGRAEVIDYKKWEIQILSQKP